MAVKDYIKKSELQLSNTDDYKKLQEPTAANMKLVHDTIERLKKKSPRTWKEMTQNHWYCIYDQKHKGYKGYKGHKWRREPSSYIRRKDTIYKQSK